MSLKLKSIMIPVLAKVEFTNVHLAFPIYLLRMRRKYAVQSLIDTIYRPKFYPEAATFVKDITYASARAVEWVREDAQREIYSITADLKFLVPRYILTECLMEQGTSGFSDEALAALGTVVADDSRAKLARISAREIFGGEFNRVVTMQNRPFNNRDGQFAAEHLIRCTNFDSVSTAHRAFFTLRTQELKAA